MSKPRSRRRRCDLLRGWVDRRRGAREATTEVRRWRRLVRIPDASERVARVQDLTRWDVRCWLEPERLDLGGHEPYTGEGVDSPRRERPPRALELRSRPARLAEERREPVLSMDGRVPTPKPAAQRRERDAALGIRGRAGAW